MSWFKITFTATALFATTISYAEPSSSNSTKAAQATTKTAPAYGNNPNIFKVLAYKTQEKVQTTAEKVGDATESGVAKVKPKMDQAWEAVTGGPPVNAPIEQKPLSQYSNNSPIAKMPVKETGIVPATTPPNKPVTTPTATPSTKPVATPSTQPIATPTATPTTMPTATPPTKPVATPTTTPTTTPTATPPTKPVATPTTTSTATPSAKPVATPTTTPTATPASQPTTAPKAQPNHSENSTETLIRL